MKVKYLVAFIFDKVSIYKEINIDKECNIRFETLYDGKYNEIPNDILEMEVRTIGAKRKGIVDIQVY